MKGPIQYTYGVLSRRFTPEAEQDLRRVIETSSDNLELKAGRRALALITAALGASAVFLGAGSPSLEVEVSEGSGAIVEFAGEAAEYGMPLLPAGFAAVTMLETGQLYLAARRRHNELQLQSPDVA